MKNNRKNKTMDKVFIEPENYFPLFSLSLSSCFVVDGKMFEKVCGQIVGEFCGCPKTYLKLFQFSYLMPFFLCSF